jgi:hypothetical protein
MCEGKKKETKAAGMVSVVIMFMLTVLGVYSVKKLNNLAHSENCSVEGPALCVIGNTSISPLLVEVLVLCTNCIWS